MPCARLSELPPPPEGKFGWPWTEETPPILSEISWSKRWPKVTIVTPSYNQAEYLEETIRSVLLQGYPNLEYIIIDGGSSDESLNIIKKYDRWIDYWVSESDYGQSHAINKGFRKATGEICGWLNSDDVYLPNAVNIVVKEFCRNNSSAISVVYGEAVYIDTEGKVIGRFGARKFSLLKHAKRNLIPQPSAFIRKSWLVHVGMLDESLQFGMDYNLWMKLGFISVLKFIPNCVSKIRCHNKSKSNNLQHIMIMEYIKTLELLVAKKYSDATRLLGRAHWLASVEFWFKGYMKDALNYAQKGIRLYRDYIRGYEFVDYLVYRMDFQSICSYLLSIQDLGINIGDTLKRVRALNYIISGLRCDAIGLRDKIKRVIVSVFLDPLVILWGATKCFCFIMRKFSERLWT